MVAVEPVVGTVDGNLGGSWHVTMVLLTSVKSKQLVCKCGIGRTTAAVKNAG